MSEITNGNVRVLPPHAELIQLAMGFIPARVLYLAAKFGLADLLADEPKSAAELAGPTGAHERALHRLMPTLSSLGGFTEGTGGRFGLTEMGEALKGGLQVRRAGFDSKSWRSSRPSHQGFQRAQRRGI